MCTIQNFNKMVGYTHSRNNKSNKTSRLIIKQIPFRMCSSINYNEIYNIIPHNMVINFYFIINTHTHTHIKELFMCF